MKKWLVFVLMGMCFFDTKAQLIASDSLNYASVSIQKDKRIDILGEKMYAYNVGLAKNIRSGKGFRLMLLTTNDRNLAMNLRSKLLQQYPEHKVYMIYQNPFIKLKMGNFIEKKDAENLKKQLLNQKLIVGNIYVIPENIEIKPEVETEQ